MSAIDIAVAPRVRTRRRMLRRLGRRPLAVGGLVVATLFVLVAILAPLVAPFDPAATNFGAVLQGPSASHIMGTDDLGRDVFSRVVFGARASLEAGVLATLLAMAVAVPLGLAAGYYRGWWDPIISRFTDVVLAFPFLIIAVGLAAIFGPSLRNVVIALGVTAVPWIVRVTRGEALALREQEFVRAAIANGAGDGTILLRHLLPNMAGTLLVQATVWIPQAIIGEAVLSFLGLGVQPPTASWGSMLSAAQPFISLDAWLAVWPGVAIFLATLSFNLLGDGLRDILDPRTQR
ncbi:MAG: peptide/nickel transport system permease protein [Solirubrobacteraceae bacterium]|jgi:peptide/nickel transport system permease protein|nr:peptide/nickel transport system permease protein [Solirubrobacteraceae bacterium]